MSESLIFRNALGNEIEFSNSSKYIITEFSPSGNVNIYSEKGYNQDGESYLGNTLDKLDLPLKLSIIGKSEKEFAQLREGLNKVFSPKLGEGILIYTNSLRTVQVPCIVSKLPFFSPLISDEGFQDGVINLIASNPFWLNSFEESEEMAAWIGGFKFALKFPTAFARAGTRITINNTGDVNTPVSIEVIGPAVNPVVTNETANQFIRVKRELLAGEKLLIETGFGNKKVQLVKANGEVQNAFHYIDLDSVLWELSVGDNIISYNSDIGKEYAKVLIKYRNRYIGI